jgi:hypothetical protein
VVYETGGRVPTTRQSALWMTRNAVPATGLLHNQAACRWRASTTITQRWGRRSASSSRPMVTEQGTRAKPRLDSARSYPGAPALLLSGSQGVAFDAADPKE